MVAVEGMVQNAAIIIAIATTKRARRIKRGEVFVGGVIVLCCVVCVGSESWGVGNGGEMG